MNALRLGTSITTITGVFAMAACTQPPAQTEAALFEQLSALCGEAFEGEVVTEDPADADFANETLTMHVRECDEDTLRIPFHVGDDRSRTWVITRLEDGRLRLKHDHRHEDGSEDVLTQYGGDSEAPVLGPTANFPADAESRGLFVREGIEASMSNVWTMGIDGDEFVYALRRPERHFEVRFDLTEPVAAPPPPWGAEE